MRMCLCWHLGHRSKAVFAAILVSLSLWLPGHNTACLPCSISALPPPGTLRHPDSGVCAEPCTLGARARHSRTVMHRQHHAP